MAAVFIANKTDGNLSKVAACIDVPANLNVQYPLHMHRERPYGTVTNLSHCMLLLIGFVCNCRWRRDLPVGRQSGYLIFDSLWPICGGCIVALHFTRT